MNTGTKKTGSKKVGSSNVSVISQELASAAQEVSLRSVTKRYGSFLAADNLSLDIPAGYYCCLLGPSGCGKTTALRMIAGHEEATSASPALYALGTLTTVFSFALIGVSLVAIQFLSRRQSE